MQLSFDSLNLLQYSYAKRETTRQCSRTQDSFHSVISDEALLPKSTNCSLKKFTNIQILSRKIVYDYLLLMRCINCTIIICDTVIIYDQITKRNRQVDDDIQMCFGVWYIHRWSLIRIYNDLIDAKDLKSMTWQTKFRSRAVYTHLQTMTSVLYHFLFTFLVKDDVLRLQCLLGDTTEIYGLSFDRSKKYCCIRNLVRTKPEVWKSAGKVVDSTTLNVFENKLRFLTCFRTERGRIPLLKRSEIKEVKMNTIAYLDAQLPVIPREDVRSATCGCQQDRWFHLILWTSNWLW